MSEENELPGGWVWTTIGVVAETTSGGTPSRHHAEYYGGAIPWVKSGELKDGIITSVEEFITQEGLKNSSAKVFPQDTALVAMYGATVGKTGILGLDATTNQAVCAIFPLKNAFTSKFITYWLQSQRQALIDQSAGGAQPNINQEIIRAFPLPLAPLIEQHRIVSAIEQQFTRLDAAVAALRRAQTKLKRYRAAVLKAAVEGKLTGTWRAEHPATEPASMLLERILEERRAKWEADLRAKGKDPEKVKYVEPARPDTESLPELPEGWCWATVEQVGDVGTGATPLRSRKEYYKDGMIPWVTSGALNSDIVTSAEEFITEKALIETNAKIFPSGTLLLAMYGEGQTRGKVAELKIEAATNQACAAIVFRSASRACQPFLKSFLLSNYFEIRRLSSGGVQPNLNLSIVKGTAIPFPPLIEQEQIVSEVEQRLSVVSELEATVEADLKRAERLRQSILREAFAGRLVPQDPDDEPASVLLERIRREREERKKGITGNGRYVRVPEPVRIDLKGTEQSELWEAKEM